MGDDPENTQIIDTNFETVSSPLILSSHILASQALSPKVPRLAFAVRLKETVNPNNLSVDHFQDWLRDIPTGVVDIKVEAGFDSFSSLLIISLPLFMAGYLRNDPAVVSLGPITSTNHLSLPSLLPPNTVTSSNPKSLSPQLRSISPHPPEFPTTVSHSELPSPNSTSETSHSNNEWEENSSETTVTEEEYLKKVKLKKDWQAMALASRHASVKNTSMSHDIPKYSREEFFVSENVLKSSDEGKSSGFKGAPKDSDKEKRPALQSAIKMALWKFLDTPYDPERDLLKRKPGTRSPHSS